MKLLSFITVIFILSINLCSNAIAKEDNQEVTNQMRKILIDKWCGNRIDSDGTIQNWTVQRHPNGSYKINFISQNPSGKRKEWGEFGIWGVRHPVYFTITTGFMYDNIEVKADTTDSELYEAYQIISLSEKEFTYKSYRSEKIFTVTKNCN